MLNLLRLEAAKEEHFEDYDLMLAKKESHFV